MIHFLRALFNVYKVRRYAEFAPHTQQQKTRASHNGVYSNTLAETRIYSTYIVHFVM